ncbi:SPFH domain-containing protein [Rubeoparvulum massiliense]|uniref:SPFH domain-containing protein n=1 Tax=Rubeoparvulum massiliense TaxID=1631346 RepID=UPI00065E831C|nr:SPFH domain-containing protein [Rubeoparvulum massiliense]
MKELKAWKVNGFLGLLIALGLVGGAVYYFIQENFWVAIPLTVLAMILFSGLVVIQPNQAFAIIFFGRYLGTIRESGLFITVPFSIHKKVSLRVRNFNSKMLKVNDVDGNPIEIAAVVVFKVVDSAKAIFDVDDYEAFVEIQSETALRHVATKYAYDTFTEGGLSLRGNAEEIAQELAQELQVRLAVAGVEVMEARLTHLAYSPEIASSMLQRQQASAIISARQKIVEGAVGMVKDALEQLESEGVVQLDEERKAQMVSNLMIAIVSDRGAQPVLNTGSLY